MKEERNQILDLSTRWSMGSRGVECAMARIPKSEL
jgi:hypothetical protein